MPIASRQGNLSETSAAPVPGAADALFELDEVAFTIGSASLLGPTSLRLAEGRMIGLVGHNGSGKTTLLRLLAKQEVPSSGRIRFRGKSLADWPRRAFARQLAYMPQRPPYAPGLTVRELVAFGRYPWHGALGRFGARDKAAVETALQHADVARFGGRLVETLSGGERQRVWLAMLIAQEPACMLLDEPISALDAAHQVETMRVIRGLNGELGLTIVVVLHDVNIAARFCDEIIALHSGRLLTRGAPEEVMDGARLEEIYGVRMGVVRHPESGQLMSFVW